MKGRYKTCKGNGKTYLATDRYFQKNLNLLDKFVNLPDFSVSSGHKYMREVISNNN